MAHARRSKAAAVAVPVPVPLPTLFGREILPLCPECGKAVSPQARQQLKLVKDKQDRLVWTRECGQCLDKDKERAKISNTTGHIDPSKHGRFGEK